MSVRDHISEQLKPAMKSGDTARTSTLRMMLAKIKDIDIAARPRGVSQVPDDEIMAALRGMVKSRRESVALYKQGNRPELADKELAEIAVIESFLPQQMDPSATEAVVAAAIAETGAASPKEMGKVMAALKAKHGAALDMGQVGAVVKAKLGGG